MISRGAGDARLSPAPAEGRRSGGSGVRSVTIHDVAEQAKVSIKTVSRVLNREPNVRAETRQRVMAVVSALHYRPNVSARSLAGSRSYLIGLLFDNPSPGYISDVQLGAFARCREEGYHLMVEPVDLSAPDLHATLESIVATLKMDGVILTPPVSDAEPVLDALEAAGVPYVRIAPDRDLERAPWVYMDDEKAAYEMTSCLLDLGHTDIGFVKGHPIHGASHLRQAGYEAALRSRNIEPRPDRIVQGYFSFRSGVEAAERLLKGSDRPTAIFASNDDMALGVMSVANRMRLNVPEDLSVAGYDDTPSAKVIWPQLTTVRQPIAEMAAAAAEMLMTRSYTQPDGRPAHRMLPFEIVARDSTAAPKAK